MGAQLACARLQQVLLLSLCKVLQRKTYGSLAHICGWLQVAQLSRLYESAAAYVTDQPAFLNAAALVDTPLSPLQLLEALKQVEVSAMQLPHAAGAPALGPLVATSSCCCQ